MEEVKKMIRYAQIDLDTGMVVSDSYLSGEVEAENMIQIEEGFDLTNKKYENGKWVEYVPKVSEIEETVSNEEIQAEILLNQAEIISKQNEHDEILAELLLGQQKGV
jgi:hypothetical protein